MSMKLRGLLVDKYSSLKERAYLREEDVIELENVKCEMVFESSGAFIEHEDARHHYLPVFHLAGHVKQITGNFPYNVSTLFFEEDDVSSLTKDCIYYPSPEELAHMIQTAGFYSERFEIPSVLRHNQYNLPVQANLTIIPPPNPTAYEAATYGELGQQDAAGVDKENLPVFYVDIKGTGIDKRNDKLLKYYGIQVESEFDTYALTAESSGYMEPPLMMYIPKPEEKTAKDGYDHDDARDYYVTDEDEFIPTEEPAKEEEPVASMAEDYTDDMEAMLLAKANRNIQRRVEERIRRKQLGREPAKEDVAELAVEPEKTDMAEPVSESVYGKGAEKKEPVPAAISHEPRVFYEVAKPETEFNFGDITPDEEPQGDDYWLDDDNDGRADSEADVDRFMDMMEQESKSLDDVAAGHAAYTPGKLSQPDTPQQYRESQMDFDLDRNLYVANDREEQADAGTADIRKLMEAKGADVADAELQADIDEAHTKELAEDAGLALQQDLKRRTDDLKEQGERLVKGLQGDTQFGE